MYNPRMAKPDGVPKVDRRTVDLSAYPDLVVIYLGMRVNAFAGLKRLLGLGPQTPAPLKPSQRGFCCTRI